MTQKVLEIDVMIYDMTKNSKIYKKIFLVTVLENKKWWNWKSPNLENNQRGEAQKYEKMENYWIFCEISERLGLPNINRNKYKIWNVLRIAGI